MKQHTIRRKTLAVIAAAAMMLANFALNGSALADTGRANPQSDVTRDRVPAILEHHRAGMSGDLWA